ncbi:hypothetical protein [Maioricimonas sp. JC845]|uniref:hypothetical protein n=1 Tax=Maioricimonas sp. JC845 TaxID=3232138 RepID=UPI0034576D3B
MRVPTKVVRASAMLCVIVVCGERQVCKGQESTGASEEVASQPDENLSADDSAPFDVDASGDPGSVGADSGYAQDPLVQEEYLSTSRAIVPQDEEGASLTENEAIQFWAFHELMLASSAATGAVSAEIVSDVEGASLSDASKALLFARHGVNGSDVAHEYGSSSRGWNPGKTWGKIREGDIHGAMGGVDFRIPGNSPTRFRDARDYSYWITVRIRNHSGWNVAMRFSGGVSARTLSHGRHFSSLRVKSEGTTARTPWVQLRQPDGSWGTRWNLKNGAVYRVVHRGGREPLAIQFE